MQLTAKKLKVPLNVQFELIHSCNNYCQFCYNVWKGKEKKNQIVEDYASFEEVKKILDQLKKSRVFSVSFTGGEPTLHPDFLKILEYSVKIGIGNSFVTNANTMDSEFAEKVKATGCKGMQISLHGPIPAVHDELSSVPGSFEKAITGIKNAREAGLFVNLNMTVTNINFRDIYATAALANDLDVNSFTITIFVTSGAGTGNSDKLCVSQADQNFILEEIKRVNQDMGFTAKILTPITLCSIDHPEEAVGRTAKCDGGLTWCAISPNGDVRTCTNIDNSLGNIMKDDLSDIWKNSETINQIYSFKHIPEECVSCGVFEFCGGGCRSRALNSSQKNFAGLDPTALPEKREETVKKTPQILGSLCSPENRTSFDNIKQLILQNPESVVPFVNMEYIRIREEEFGLIAAMGSSFMEINQDGINILKHCDGKKNLKEISTVLHELFPQMELTIITDHLNNFIINAAVLKMLTISTK